MIACLLALCAAAYGFAQTDEEVQRIERLEERYARLAETREWVRAKITESGNDPDADDAMTVDRDVEQRLIAEFGEETVKVTNGAIVIWREHDAAREVAYEPEPYVVERRGLNIYLNGRILGNPWKKWPIGPDAPLEKDPGEPPLLDDPYSYKPIPNSDETITDFWVRKRMYLAQHYPKEEAVRRLEAELKKASERAGGAWKVKDNPLGLEYGFVGIERPDGQFIGMQIPDWPPPPPPSNEELLDAAQSEYKSLVRKLRSAGTLFYNGGERAHLNPSLLDAVELMTSGKSLRERVAAASAAGSESFRDYAELFMWSVESTPELERKLESWRAALDEQVRSETQETSE